MSRNSHLNLGFSFHLLSLELGLWKRQSEFVVGEWHLRWDSFNFKLAFSYKISQHQAFDVSEI